MITVNRTIDRIQQNDMPDRMSWCVWCYCRHHIQQAKSFVNCLPLNFSHTHQPTATTAPNMMSMPWLFVLFYSQFIAMYTNFELFLKWFFSPALAHLVWVLTCIRSYSFVLSVVCGFLMLSVPLSSYVMCSTTNESVKILTNCRLERVCMS